MIRKEDAAEGSPRHQPDYSVLTHSQESYGRIRAWRNSSRSSAFGRSSRPSSTHSSHLPPNENRNAVRQLALITLAHGLGSSTQGSQMGEPTHGLAVIRRLHERRARPVQEQRRRNQLREQAGVRILCAGAE